MAIDATENSNYKNPEAAHKLNSIQFCRAIAFLMVLMLHRTPTWDLFYIFQYGNYGVLLFFIISGFIITFLHLNGKIEGTRKFLIKRFARIFPIYWITTLLCIMVAYYNYQTGFDGWSPLADFAQIGWIQTFTLLPLQDGWLVNVVAWSLIYEIWYYILFAIFIYLLRNKFILGVIGYAYLVLVIQLAFPQIISSDFLGINWSIIFSTLNWFFIMGACIAYISFDRSGKYKLLCYITLLSCFLFQILIGYKNQYAAKGGQITELVLLTASLTLVIGSMYLETFKNIKFPKPIIFIGNISYTLYLFHYVWVEIVRGVFSEFIPGLYKDSITEKTAYYISLFIISFIIYKYIEIPSNKFLRKKLLSKKALST
ncbi:TPA: acyltransferase [Yersinia enterocolitica]|uniref:acyltransferase family protein n=2 Tax=Yersinia enterocolitica TaxID=630 RepID=UPI0032FFE8F4|nr:acyltransferase [Yersinia enterocolitica]HDL6984523.1 acyltransferase [Yersinia enterocolitica]HDL7067164.1 acyltransferase [Yersinia enterocolitica]HDL7071551.1 acyltransferase [Yersinia enterocolitica]HDL7429493.1 acyltransferase [Yersinia enterocolitica]